MIWASGLVISTSAVFYLYNSLLWQPRRSHVRYMPQSFANTPELIYNVLANDPLITNRLGEYTFVGGTTYPSIALLTPGQSLPNLEAQEGLECIIHDSGDVTRKDYLSGSSDLMTLWKVFVIVWDPATGSDLDFVVKRIMHLFYGSTSIETLSVAQGARARVQTMVLIPEAGGLHEDGVSILENI